MPLFTGKLNRIQYALYMGLFIILTIALWYFVIRNMMGLSPMMGMGSMMGVNPSGMSYTLPDGIAPLPQIGYTIIGVFVLYISLIFYAIIIASKRLRDRQHSPWWALLLFVGGLNIALFIYLLFAPSK